MEGRQPLRKISHYGYHIVRKADIIRGAYKPEQEGRYVIIEPEAQLVRQIYDWYANESGVSLMEIVRRLTEMGATTRDGRRWTRGGVRSVLTNVTYKGVAHYGRLNRGKDESRLGQLSERTGAVYKSIYFYREAPAASVIYIPCPAIVDEAIWERAQARSSENKRSLSGRPDRRYMITGLMICPKCGLRMRSIGSVESKGPYYICRHDTPARSPDGIVCSTRCFPVASSDALAAQAVQALVTRADVLAAAARAWRDEKRREFADRREALPSEDTRAAVVKELEEKLSALNLRR